MIEKRYKLSDLKLVRVDWLDAMSDDNTWQELEELTKQVLRPVSCVGWILTETKDNIILISSFDEESQCGGGGCTIPKSCILNCVQLNEGGYVHSLNPQYRKATDGIHN